MTYDSKDSKFGSLLVLKIQIFLEMFAQFTEPSMEPYWWSSLLHQYGGWKTV